MGRRDDDEGRERLSWRERDRLHDHPEEREEPGERSRGERLGAGHGAYKMQLDRLFEEGVVGRLLDDILEERKLPKEESGARAGMIRTMRSASDTGERNQALDALLEAGEALPDDVALLSTLVDHPREEVVRQLLQHMELLLDQQPLKRKASFLVRLDTLLMTAKDGALLAVAERLKQRLG